MSQGEQQKAKGNDEKESGMEVVSAPDLPGGGSSNVIDGGNGVDGVMEPMAIGTSNVADTAATEQQGGGWFCFHRGGSKDFLNPHQRLFVSPKAMKWSLSVLRFGVLASSVSATILQPNYPIMVLPGAHQDSFPSTSPFDFNSATYFIPMTALLGVAVSSTIIGAISDKIGRKICIMVSLWGSTFGSALKFFLSFNFWAFCGANFLNGLFSAALPVALAYVGDATPTREEKRSEIGALVGFSMIGMSGGGICAILMSQQGLFMPLWIGVALCFVAAVLCQCFLLEPGRDIHAAIDEADKGEEDEEEQKAPKVINQKHLWNIVIGAFADNIGSSGLMPLCLSPLAFNRYYTDFIDQDPPQLPIMTQDAYKWISVLVALMVLPGTLVSPWFFRKAGAAGGCVIGNLITGILTIVLLFIALSAPATGGWFGVFVSVLYVGFPFTVVSQLSTGPMLDTISPVNKRGYCQGLNTTVMNFGTAVSPWIFGILADSAGTPVAIWSCIGISFLAAILNAPLLLIKGLGPAPKEAGKESKALKWEDRDLIERALRGDWVPASALDRINQERRKKGQPYLVVPYGKYDDDKDRLYDIRKHAQEDFTAMSKRMEEAVGTVNKVGLGSDALNDVCNQLTVSLKLAQDREDELNKELGCWFTDHLKQSGYFPHLSAPIMKQMILSTFPVITRDTEINKDNILEVILNAQRMYNQFSKLEYEVTYYDLTKILNSGKGGASQFRAAL